MFFIKVKRHQSFKDGKCRGFYPCPFGRGTPYKRFIDKKEQQECSELCAKNINGNIKWRIRICSDDIQMHLSTNVQCCAEVFIDNILIIPNSLLGNLFQVWLKKLTHFTTLIPICSNPYSFSGLGCNFVWIQPSWMV